MIIFPAIDILDGKVVRLRQGDFDQVTVYNDDPIDQARQFAMAGATWVHIVDLEGARSGAPTQLELVKEIAREVGLLVQFGGGIRDIETVEQVMKSDVNRIVLGTGLVSDTAFAKQAGKEFGPILVAGVDARDGKVAIEGWREGTETAALELISELASYGYGHLVYTDIARDGMQTGIDADAYRRVAKAAGFPVVASGGVSTLEDISALAALGDDVIEGVITGRALYEGVFTIDAAIALGSGVDLELYQFVREKLDAGELEEPQFIQSELE